MASFKEFVSLDTCTVVCPCGASVTYPDGDSDFTKKHLAHTDGKMDSHITDDGMRCLTSDYPRDSTIEVK